LSEQFLIAPNLQVRDGSFDQSLLRLCPIGWLFRCISRVAISSNRIHCIRPAGHALFKLLHAYAQLVNIRIRAYTSASPMWNPVTICVMRQAYQVCSPPGTASRIPYEPFTSPQSGVTQPCLPLANNPTSINRTTKKLPGARRWSKALSGGLVRYTNTKGSTAVGL
jgi:hypothetical protein